MSAPIPGGAARRAAAEESGLVLVDARLCRILSIFSLSVAAVNGLMT